MDSALKQRLIGAAVLVALAVVFLPMLVNDDDPADTAADLPLEMPAAPNRDTQTRELPLVLPSPAPANGALGMPSPQSAGAVAPASGNPDRLATVDAGANVAPRTDALPLAPAGAPAGDESLPAGSAAAPSGAAAPATAPTVVAAVPAATGAPAQPLPASLSGGGYVVNAGIYSNASNANKLVANLKSAGLAAYAEPSALGNKPAVRVRIGPFGQRAQAETARLDALRVRSDLSASVIALDAAAAGPTVSNPAGTAAPASTRPAIVAFAPAAATRPPPASQPPAAPARAGFAVQVGAFRSEVDANAMRDRIRAAGLGAFSQRINAESGILYRVRVGPSADRAGAERMRGELNQTLKLSGNVVTHP